MENKQDYAKELQKIIEIFEKYQTEMDMYEVVQFNLLKALLAYVTTMSDVEIGDMHWHMLIEETDYFLDENNVKLSTSRPEPLASDWSEVLIFRTLWAGGKLNDIY